MEGCWKPKCLLKRSVHSFTQSLALTLSSSKGTAPQKGPETYGEKLNRVVQGESHLCSSVCYTPGLSAVAEKLWPHQHQCPLGSHGLPNWTQCLRAAAGRESIPKSSKVNQKSKVMKHNKEPL